MENILEHIHETYPEIKDANVIEYGQYENLTLYWIFDNGIKIEKSPLSLIDELLGLLKRK